MKREGHTVTFTVFTPDGEETDELAVFDLALPEHACAVVDTLINTLEGLVDDMEKMEEEYKNEEYLKINN